MGKALEPEIVHKICKMIENGQGITEISKELNIPKYKVTDIRCGRTFKYISENYNIFKNKRIINRLDNDTVHKICKMIEDGYGNEELSKIFNITSEYIGEIKNGKYHSNISKKYNFQKRELNHYDSGVIHNICKMIEDGYRNIDIITTCNVPATMVSYIRCGLRHTDISKEYNIQYHSVKRRYDKETVDNICKLLKEGKSARYISETTGVSKSTIKTIKLKEYANIHKDE